MNEARKRVEQFKRSANSIEMSKVRLNVKLPENYRSLDYHARNKADTLALDEAIAQHLGVAISDRETWPDEQAQINAKEWAQSLPDA